MQQLETALVTRCQIYLHKMQPEISRANSLTNAHHSKLGILKKNICGGLLLLLSLQNIGT
jgi:hypothetical protein